MMVPNSQRTPSSEGLHPLQIHEGRPVTIQGHERLFKGTVHLVEEPLPGFEVVPPLDINRRPMGQPVHVPWQAMMGDTAEYRVFPR